MLSEIYQAHKDNNDITLETGKFTDKWSLTCVCVLSGSVVSDSL